MALALEKVNFINDLNFGNYFIFFSIERIDGNHFLSDESNQSSVTDENECEPTMEISDSADDSPFNHLNIPKDKYEKYLQDLNEFARNFVKYNEKIGQVLTLDDIEQIIHQVSFKMIKNLCIQPT